MSKNLKEADFDLIYTYVHTHICNTHLPPKIDFSLKEKDFKPTKSNILSYICKDCRSGIFASNL